MPKEELGTNLFDKRLSRHFNLSIATLDFIRGEVKEVGFPKGLRGKNGRPRVYRRSRHEDTLSLEAQALERLRGKRPTIASQ